MTLKQIIGPWAQLSVAKIIARKLKEIITLFYARKIPARKSIAVKKYIANFYIYHFSISPHVPFYFQFLYKFVLTLETHQLYRSYHISILTFLNRTIIMSISDLILYDFVKIYHFSHIQMVKKKFYGQSLSTQTYIASFSRITLVFGGSLLQIKCTSELYSEIIEIWSNILPNRKSVFQEAILRNGRIL